MGKRSSLLALLAVTSIGLVSAQQLKSGIDPTAFDKSVRPQDDLFRYVNGDWLTKTEIPADRPVYGTFVQLAEKAEADLYALIEQLAGDRNKKPGSVAQQVGDLYASFTNEARLNTLGADPLKSHLAEIDAVNSPAALATLLGRLSVIGLPGPVGGFIEADAGDPTKVALYLGQGGTALPDRDYYLKDDPKFADIRTKYQQYLEQVFTLAGRPRAAADAKAVVRPRDRAREDSVDAGREPRRRQDLQQISGRQARQRDARLRLDGLGEAASHRQGTGVGDRPAVLLQGIRGDGANRAARHVEGLDGGPADHDARALLEQGVRRRPFRVLRQDVERPGSATAALEARRPARQRIDGRGARPALRRQALPGGVEGAHGDDDRQPDRGLPAVDHRARLDDARDEEGSARQAGEVQHEDRLPQPMARITARSRSRPTTSSATSSAPISSRPSIRSPSWASPSTARNG